MKNNSKRRMMLMAKLKGKQITKTYTDSEGNELTIIFSHPGVRNSIQILQSSYTPEGGINVLNSYDGFLDKVIKKEDGSKTTVEFWNDWEDVYEEVMNDAQKFLKGKLTQES